MSTRTQTTETSSALRWAVIVAIAGVAFFGSYRFAVAQTSAPQSATGTVASGPTGTVTSVSGGGGCCGAGGSGSGAAAAAPSAGAAAAAPTGSGAAASTAGGGCCGGGASGPATTKKADVAGGVQKITVDLSKGYYDPSTIELKAGVPAEITFGQSSGCTAQVQSQQLGFFEDLTSGPKTIKLDALQAGTYQFTCGMGMASGSIVVK